jgi:hypothetical protein
VFKIPQECCASCEQFRKLRFTVKDPVAGEALRTGPELRENPDYFWSIACSFCGRCITVMGFITRKETDFKYDPEYIIH